MSRRAIDRRDWPEFVDGFSRRHDGWLVSVAVEEGTDARRYLMRDVPLRGIVREGDAMVIFTEDATHFVEKPAALAVGETAEGAEAELTVTAESGGRTIVELRTPIRPELVDGIA